MTFEMDIEPEPWRASEYGNLALVQAVKQRPCLYNNTIPEYTMKEVTRAAWQEIADEFGCSVPVLKKQWQRLRSAFLKDLKKRKKGKKSVHYLAETMDFIYPYVLKNQQQEINHSTQANICNILQSSTPPQRGAVSLGFQLKKPGVLMPKKKLKITITEPNGMSNTENTTPSNDKLKFIHVTAVSQESDETHDLNKELKGAIAKLKEPKNQSPSKSLSFSTELGELINPQLHNLYNKLDTSFSRLPNSDEESVTDQVDPQSSNNFSSVDEHGDQLLVNPTVESCSSSSICSQSQNLLDAQSLRKYFVLSLLPEIEEMSDYQFVVLQGKLLRLIDTVKCKK